MPTNHQPAEGGVRKALPTAPDRPLPAFRAKALAVALYLAENGVNAIPMGKGALLRTTVRRGEVIYDTKRECWQYRGKHFNGSEALFATWIKEQS